MRRRLVAAIVVVVLVGASVAVASLVRRALHPSPSFYLGGIQVNEARLDHWLDRLQAVGMNTVSVTDYAHQGNWDSYNLWWDEDIEGELREIRAAKAEGLRVVLILRVALDHAFPRNEFLWHGMIQPADRGQLDEWFRRYTDFTLRWAEVAEREDVDVLVIGSELNALTSTTPLEELPVLHEWYLNEDKRQETQEVLLEYRDRIERRHLVPRGRQVYPSLSEYLESRIATERSWARETGASLAAMNDRRRVLEAKWIELIGKVREVYQGPVGYAANFDQYDQVGFWRHLDWMGINAYFQLRRHLVEDRTPATLYPALMEGWRRVLGDISAFRQARDLDLPVMFTEIGYTYRANSTLEPWAADGFSLLPQAAGDGLHGVEETERIVQDPPRKLVIWQDQPVDLEERALAVRALHQAHEELEEPFLRGLLYWKLSSEPVHFREEPFVLLIDEGRQDPLLTELQRFVE